MKVSNVKSSRGGKREFAALIKINLRMEKDRSYRP